MIGSKKASSCSSSLLISSLESLSRLIKSSSIVIGAFYMVSLFCASVVIILNSVSLLVEERLSLVTKYEIFLSLLMHITPQ